MHCWRSEIKILIISERWSIPNYRNGQTEKDSKLMRLEIESDTWHTTRYAENMSAHEVITRLKLIRSIVDSSIREEEKRLKNADKKSI